MCIWHRDAYKVKDLGDKEIDAYKLLGAHRYDGEFSSPVRTDPWVNDSHTSYCPPTKERGSDGIYCFKRERHASKYGDGRWGSVEVWLKISGVVAYHHRTVIYPAGYRAQKARIVGWRKPGTKKWWKPDELPSRVAHRQMEEMRQQRAKAAERAKPDPMVLNKQFLRTFNQMPSKVYPLTKV